MFYKRRIDVDLGRGVGVKDVDADINKLKEEFEAMDYDRSDTCPSWHDRVGFWKERVLVLIAYTKSLEEKIEQLNKEGE